MTSLEEVARRAGVSAATVSRALSGRGRLSDATRLRVQRAAADLGYVVSATASSLATGRTRSVGVLVPLLGRWFFSNVLDGIATTLGRHGYDITLYNVTADPDQRRHLLRTALRRGRVDAVVALSLDFSDAEIDELESLGLPIIGLGTPSRRLSTLRVDDAAVARVATTHLLDLGHRRIAHIGQSRDGEADLDIPTLRRRGFEAALHEAGAEPAGFATGDFTIEAGYRATQRLLQETRPTAVFAASDELAFGALFAARDAGLEVPRDISVIGVDGHELGGFFGLTTIEQFPHAQGARVAETVLATLGEDVATPASDLPFALVERTSTAPPR
ncbi:MAG: LacI family transcriptional regulator [Microbacterium sp.]|nr:MAG: LacI family transcriptional regulator [Microbacterium sp.]